MNLRAALRWLLAFLYAVAGALHLALPAPFVGITPDWVPMPGMVVAVTGVCELAGAAGLMIPRLRRAAGAMLALYALCVWPANFNHAAVDLAAGTGLGWWYHAPRLALQPAIIWWALFAGGLVTWPFRAERPAP